jgi:hypothetical protein
MKTRWNSAGQQRKGRGSSRPRPRISSSPRRSTQRRDAGRGQPHGQSASAPSLGSSTAPHRKSGTRAPMTRSASALGRHRHDLRLQMLRPRAPDDPFGGEQHDRRYAERCGKVADPRVVAEIRGRPAQRSREDWSCGSSSSITRRINCEDSAATASESAGPVNHDGETRPRRRESLENGGEFRRRPALPTPRHRDGRKGADAIEFDLEERREPERVDVAGSIHDASAVRSLPILGCAARMSESSGQRCCRARSAGIARRTSPSAPGWTTSVRGGGGRARPRGDGRSLPAPCRCRSSAFRPSL